MQRNALLWILGLTVGLCAGLPMVRAVVAEPFRVTTASMAPTLLMGDTVLVRKTVYGLHLPLVGEVVSWSDPRRGDLVHYRHPTHPAATYIGRVVGLPGEVVEVRQHRVSIDGAMLPSQEDRLVEILGPRCEAELRVRFRELDHELLLPGPNGTTGRLADHGPEEVPDWAFFVMADHRAHGEDSRAFGAVDREAILGRVEFIGYSWDACTDAARTDRRFTSP